MQLISWMVGRSLDNLYPKEEVDIGDIVFEARNVTQEGVIENIDVNVRKGEILGISGLAGAGRTELALALCGLEKPDSAELYINGERVQIRNYRDAMGQGIDYVSEDRHRYSLILAMRLKDNITHKVLYKITKPLGFIDFNKLEQVNNSYMRSLDIKAPDGNAIVNKLSGGNQQKVAVAKSLAVEPQILILDEPTRGVDVGAKSEIHRIISHLAKEGKSIILISSDLPEILGMSDRVLVMKQGRKMGELSRHELSQEKILHMAL
jgi:ABC-type sugar transport system ATPase subunit